MPSSLKAITNWIRDNITTTEYEVWRDVRDDEEANKNYILGHAKACSSKTKKPKELCRREISRFLHNQDTRAATNPNPPQPRDPATGRFVPKENSLLYSKSSCDPDLLQQFASFTIPALLQDGNRGVETIFDEGSDTKVDSARHIVGHIVDRSDYHLTLSSVAASEPYRRLEAMARASLRKLMNFDPGEPTASVVNLYQSVDDAAPDHRDPSVKGSVLVVVRQEEESAPFFISPDPIDGKEKWEEISLSQGDVLTFVPRLSHAFRGGCKNRCVLIFFF